MLSFYRINAPPAKRECTAESAVQISLYYNIPEAVCQVSQSNKFFEKHMKKWLERFPAAEKRREGQRKARRRRRRRPERRLRSRPRARPFRRRRHRRKPRLRRPRRSPRSLLSCSRTWRRPSTPRRASMCEAAPGPATSLWRCLAPASR